MHYRKLCSTADFILKKLFQWEFDAADLITQNNKQKSKHFYTALWKSYKLN